MEKKTYASHRDVRNAFIRMQKCGGSPIVPLALFPLFSRFIFNEDQSTVDVEARSYAYIFSAICNEYFVMFRNSKFPKIEFYISEERWDKYKIAPENRENGIAFLERIGLIVCEQKIIPPDNRSERTFKISFDKLDLYTRYVEEVYEEAQSAKYPF